MDTYVPRNERPTPGQKKYCADLGIDLPPYATRRDATKLLDDELGRRKVARMKEREGRVKAVMALLRESGVRPGSILDRCGVRYVATQHPDAEYAYVRELASGASTRFAIAWPDGDGYGYALTFTHVCPPPEGWVHVYVVAKRLAGKRRKRSIDQHLADLRSQLPPDARLWNEYGEHWSLAAVAELS